MRRVGRLALAFVVVSGLVSRGAISPAAEEAAPDPNYYEMMKLFVDTFEQIDRNYVNEVDRRELIEAAMRGMIAKLDPYSSYIDPDELERFNSDVEQEFGGIGIQVTVDVKTRQLLVMTPLPGTPAYKAGIRAGDRVIEIDGKPTAEFPEGREMDSAVKMMRGKPGEPVKVTILHEGTASPETIEIVRAVIKTPTVLGDHYNPDGSWSYFLDGPDKVGYLRLTHFSRNSADEMEAALEQLQKDGMKALVLDLRFNPGGLLQSAIAIADLFVESGRIVSTKGRNTEEQVTNAHKAGTIPFSKDFPIVVLVNRYSASASEILSACLQDHSGKNQYVARIVGERTWGKGSVQNVIELDSGKSALKLTTASYHRPSGKNIHRFPDSKETDEWGVMPDDGFLVKLQIPEMEAYVDYRRERDVLRTDGTVAPSEYKDPQLEKGLAWVREKLTGVKPAEEKPADAADPTKTQEKKNDAASLPVDLNRQSIYADVEWAFGRFLLESRSRAAAL
jgi:carboxyl-terminal processing protease